MMLRYAFLVHPATGVPGLYPVILRGRFPNPRGCGPKAYPEINGLVEFLGASALPMVGHLEIVAVKVIPVLSQKVIPAFYVGISKEYHALDIIPDSHDHRLVVVVPALQ